jgi:8-hydroxy-5-deazaflavin:NADPH oxidoreductase
MKCAIIGSGKIGTARARTFQSNSDGSIRAARPSSEMVAEMAVGARIAKSISSMPMAWIQDFSPQKPRTVIFISGDDTEAKQLVIELINSTGLVAIDLGSLATGGAMHEVGAPLSGIEFHFVRRLR